MAKARTRCNCVCQMELPFRAQDRNALRTATSGAALSQASLRKLQREWDQKLRATGFVDIEWRHSKGPDYIQRPRGKFDVATGSYYRLAQRFSQEIEDERERTLWELHSNGASRTQIKGAFGLGRDREVRTVFERIRARFRFWVLRQIPDEEEALSDEEEIAATFARLSGGL